MYIQKDLEEKSINFDSSSKLILFIIFEGRTCIFQNWFWTQDKQLPTRY